MSTNIFPSKKLFRGLISHHSTDCQGNWNALFFLSP